jgi:aspartate carbamoyltransferase catalytic subunit
MPFDHVVSINDFSNEEIKRVFDIAEHMLPAARGEVTNDLLRGRILATLFFEPSTRTRLSFESAMSRLGGNVIGFSDPSGTSVVKGETLADTIRMAEAYADVIVLRHPREGAARLASGFSRKPVLNAGDGAGQHPTQTLLDLFTILHEKGNIEDQHVVLVGDLKYGRTVHSLAYALTRFGAELSFVSPKQLTMPEEITSDLAQSSRIHQSDSLEEVIGDADIIYVTRIQKERFPDPAEYIQVADAYRIDLKLLEKGKPDVRVMHPLPRVNEIAPEVDHSKYSCYFKQAFNGVPVRMALLGLVTGVLE